MGICICDSRTCEPTLLAENDLFFFFTLICIRSIARLVKKENLYYFVLKRSILFGNLGRRKKKKNRKREEKWGEMRKYDG